MDEWEDTFDERHGTYPSGSSPEPMNPTPEAVVVVARTLQQEAAVGRASYRDMATAAIEAATPFIRQALFDELIDWVETHIEDEYSSVGLEWSDISSWLRERKDADHG